MSKNHRPHAIDGALWAVETEEERKTFLSFPYSFCAASMLFGIVTWAFIFAGIRPALYDEVKKKPMQVVLLAPPLPLPPAPAITPPIVERALAPPPPKAKPNPPLQHRRPIAKPPSALPPPKQNEPVNEAPAQVEPLSEKPMTSGRESETKTAIAPPAETTPSVVAPRSDSRDGTEVRLGAVPIYKEECAFPRDAEGQGILSGDVTARLNVDESGNVVSVGIIKANPLRVFDREIKRCMSKWKFLGDGKAYTVDKAFRFRQKDR